MHLSNLLCIYIVCFEKFHSIVLKGFSKGNISPTSQIWLYVRPSVKIHKSIAFIWVPWHLSLKCRWPFALNLKSEFPLVQGVMGEVYVPNKVMVALACFCWGQKHWGDNRGVARGLGGLSPLSQKPSLQLKWYFVQGSMEGLTFWVLVIPHHFGKSGYAPWWQGKKVGAVRANAPTPCPPRM